MDGEPVGGGPSSPPPDSAERLRPSGSSVGRRADRLRAVAEERRRIARDLQDVAAQHLTAVVVRAEMASRVGTVEALRAATGFAAETAGEALESVREVVGVLAAGLDAAPAPDDLAATLRWMERAACGSRGADCRWPGCPAVWPPRSCRSCRSRWPMCCAPRSGPCRRPAHRRSLSRGRLAGRRGPAGGRSVTTRVAVAAGRGPGARRPHRPGGRGGPAVGPRSEQRADRRRGPHLRATVKIHVSNILIRLALTSACRSSSGPTSTA